MAERRDILTWPLMRVDGGYNTRVGERLLKPNETRHNRNTEIILGGGVQKPPGWTPVMNIPFPCQDAFFYRCGDPPACSWELIVYAFPCLYRIDIEQGTIETLKNNLMSTGDPVVCQLREKMFICDGVNTPMIYNGQTITNIVWPPTYPGGNNKDKLDSVFARQANPTSDQVTVPHAAIIYKNRVIAISREKGRIYMSKADNIAEFSDNSGSPIPIDIPVFLDLPTPASFTGLRQVSDGVILYGLEEMWKLTGDNIPLPGLPNTFEFRLINDRLGAVAHKMIEQKDDNDHYFMSRYGLYDLQQAENFDKERPGGRSYKIQNEFDALGAGSMRRSRMFAVPNKGQLWITTPRRRTHLYLDKIWKLNYAVNEEDENANPWSLFEYFGQFTRFDAMFVLPPKNDVYCINDTTIYKNTGNSYFNSSPIQMEYEWPPVNFNHPGRPKGILDYIIRYYTSTGANIFLGGTWDHGGGGTTFINLPAILSSTAGSAGYGTASGDGYTASSAFLSNVVKIPPTGGTQGDAFKVRLSHHSAVEDLIIYSIDVRYTIRV